MRLNIGGRLEFDVEAVNTSELSPALPTEEAAVKGVETLLLVEFELDCCGD